MSDYSSNYNNSALQKARQVSRMSEKKVAEKAKSEKEEKLDKKDEFVN